MSKRPSILLFTMIMLLFLNPLAGCSATPKNDKDSSKIQSEPDKKNETVLLFNGKNTNGWHTFNKDSADPCWHVENGILTLNHDYKGGGSLITDKAYKNFILTLDWKISKAGNSGIFVNVKEDPKYKHAYLTAPEMQVLDNKDAEDNKDSTHLAGSLYDIITCPPSYVKPAGEWNKVKIKQVDGNIIYTINNHKVAQIQIGSKKWKQRIANSKFKGLSDFGQAQKGHIGLQDHGHKVSYRNIKLEIL